MAGFGLDMGSLLRRKYDIAQQEADASTVAANARAVGAERQFGGPAPGQVMTLGFGNNAVGAGVDPVVNPLDDDLLKARIGAAKADTANSYSQMSDRAEQTLQKEKALDQLYNSKTPDPVQARVMAFREMYPGQPVPASVYNDTFKGLKRGLTKVPGKGTRDTMPAMLAPGEAVLNANAAKKLGRGLIAYLNAYGNRKADKGMV